MTSIKINIDLQEVDWDQEAIERAKQAGKWNEERRTMLWNYVPMYLQTMNNSLAAGGTLERLDDITQNYPANTILYRLGTYKNKTTELKTPRKTVSFPSWYSPTFHKRPQSRHMPNPLQRNLV